VADAGKLTDKKREENRVALRQMLDARENDPELVQWRSWLLKVYKSNDIALCSFAATQMIENSVLTAQNAELVKRLNDILRYSEVLSAGSKLSTKLKRAIAPMVLKHRPENTAALVYSQVMKFEEKASKRGRSAANALHDKPGGTRSKQVAIRAAWASGKYTSRGICAEQECAALGMSFDAARKALRNTPKPA
jgi:hypothetical protein